MAYAYVYIFAKNRYSTLYVGVTSDLIKRAYEHREGIVEGFTKKYGLDRLAWYEEHDSMVEAITREKRVKGWRRDWKVNLIQSRNPTWCDLYRSLLQ